MPLEARLLTGLGLALFVAFCATPVAIRAAYRFDFYDRPIGYKGHASPTPYLGGAAVIAAFAFTLALLAGSWQRTAPLLGGVIVLWAVGTLDDRRHLSPLLRVAIEVALAAALFALGQGWDLGSAPLSLGVTVVWVVAVVNAFNLFDNMDGATSSMAAVISAAVAVLGIVIGDRWLAVAGIALCGACAGFLPYNLAKPGARIFLGDGGSMPIGFAVAALVMSGTSAAAPEWQALAMGLMLVGVPALDTALVVVSRTRRGISLLTGGRDHLTHRTRALLRNARAVAVALGGVQVVLSALAIVAVGGGPRALVAAVAVYMVSIGVAIAVLDTRLAPMAVTVPPGDDEPAIVGRPRRSAAEVGPYLAATVLGLGIGLSPLFFGYYDPTFWVPAGLALSVAAVAGAIASPPRLARPAVLVLGGLAALALWALASSLWADSVEQAITNGNRLLVYVALLGVLIVFIRTREAALALISVIAACCVGLAAVTLGRMLAGDPLSLFLGGRLDDPLGYINGQANYYLLGAWLCFAGAVQRRSKAVALTGVAATTLLLSLVILSQSRGVALATIVSAAAVLAFVPARLRHAWALVAVGVPLALAAPTLLDVFATLENRMVTPEVARRAALAAMAAAAGSALAWAAVIAIAERPVGRSLRRPAVFVLGAGVAVLLALAVVNQGAIRSTVNAQYSAFVQVGSAPEIAGEDDTSVNSRLSSGAGNRYDYWRIALGAFERRPLLGVGAGNYDRSYFLERATTEDVRQPHSLQLQTLAELGLIGAALLAMFLAGVALGFRRTLLAARSSASARALGVAGVGAVTAWLTHTSVDWIHLLPGVTAIALVLAVAAATVGPEPASPAEVARRRPMRPRLLPAVGVAVILAVAGISLSRQGMTEYFRTRAQAALAEDPATALRQADRAVRLDPEAVDSYYVKAAALARFGEGEAARQVLLDAAAREPRKFLTWVLLGDLATRRGRDAEAQRHYRRALALNPRDLSLQQLAGRSATPRPE